MALNLVATNNTILASDVNQFVNVLQRSAGQADAGAYYLTFNSGSGVASGGAWVSSQSRGATPVSATTDTSMQAVQNCGSPSTDHLTSIGVHVFSSTTGTTAAANAGGLCTIQY